MRVLKDFLLCPAEVKSQNRRHNSLMELRDSFPAPCVGQPGSWKDKQAWQNNPLKCFMETNLAYLVEENSCYSFLMRLMLWEISPSAYSLSRILCCPRRYSTEWNRQHMPACVALTHSYFHSVLQPLLKPRFHLHPLPPVQNIINCLRGSLPRCPSSPPPSLSRLSQSKRPSNNFWLFIPSGF